MTDRKRTLGSSVWVLGGSSATHFIRLCSNVVLTHLLVPEMFGLMTLVNIFLYALTMLSDLGIHANIVQHPKAEEDDFLRTAFALQMIRGFVLYVLCVALAYPFAHFYEEPILQILIQVAAVSVIITGFISPKLYVLRRRILLARETMIEVMSYLFAVVIMILIAWKTGSIWALVVGGILGNLAQTIMSYPLTGSKFVRPAINREAARQIIHFGKWILLGSTITLLATQSDRLLFGKLMSLSDFGVFSIAYMMANTVSLFVSQLSERIVFPFFASRFRSDRSQYTTIVLKVRKQILSLCIPIILIIFLLSQHVIDWLYPSDYHSAGIMVLFLIPWLWAKLLFSTLGPALLGAGDSKSAALAGVTQFVATILGIVIGFKYIGFTGGLLGMAFGPLAGYLVAQERLKAKTKILIQSFKYSIFFGIPLVLIYIMKGEIAMRMEGNEDLFVMTTSLAILIVFAVQVGSLFRGQLPSLSLGKDT